MNFTRLPFDRQTDKQGGCLSSACEAIGVKQLNAADYAAMAVAAEELAGMTGGIRRDQAGNEQSPEQALQGFIQASVGGNRQTGTSNPSGKV